MGVTQTWV